MALLNNIQALNNALDLAMEKYKNIVLYGEDVGFEGGVFRATVGLQAKYGENRCFDSPISEATLVGSAVGMALNGLLPIVEIQFQGFIYPSLQQIFSHVSRFRNRSRGRFYTPLIIRMPMGGGIRALEHHSEAMEVIFAHIPGVIVIIPSTPFDTKGLLLAAVESKDPVIFLESTKIYRAFKQNIPDEYYTLPIGRAYKIQQGTDITVVTYGAQTFDCQKAIQQLQKENFNISVELIDLRTIKPWDYKLVVDSVKKTGRLLVVHEAVKSFSISSEIITTVNEKCFEYLKAPCGRVTGYDVVVPFDRGEHFFHPSIEKIVFKIKEIVNYQI